MLDRTGLTMKLYVAVILAVVFLENFGVHIVRETLASQTIPISSCVDLRTDRIGIKRISDYEIQNRPVKAVILITRTGVKVCVPHDLPWVKKTVRMLDQKKAKVQKRNTTGLNAATH